MIDLDEVKLFLRVDHTEEDSLIEDMVKTAQQATFDYLNWVKIPKDIPSPVNSAILLMVGDLYENRERQTEALLYQNRTYERLLNPYRIMEI